ncbi:MAG: restriction endonuclease subunit R [Beggiatoa sp. IS2]|nr:MAG: restriction endonuclease subunit R [Beggiatoa sp. IS2]
MHNIQLLVERFFDQADNYQQISYNETQTRNDFINPFFQALDWDVNNQAGLAERYRQVIHEDALKMGRATKKPDYSFRVGGVRKFFVEAKKPAVSLKNDREAAFQVRRYGWSAKLPLSIITNFKEFAVYDCRIKPSKTDSASTARLWYLTYTEYLSQWELLVDKFSFEAVWQGKLDRYITTQKSPKGTLEVDAAFLAEIERWREILARHIAIENAHLNQRQLNFVVQQTIDRIIFLRICEDRGIEDYGRLLAVTNGSQVYPRLFKLFREADERYNSGLFHFKVENERDTPDELTPILTIADEILRNIVKSLYYPESPYEFSVLPTDILGQIYEQFLGKVIRVTPNRTVEVEEKPEVKKAGGVYYTPTYIVDYIVKQTLTPLLAGKKAGPRGSASQLRIVDPACGSGSFLLGAYQFLLDWHLEQYLQNPERWAKGKNPCLYQVTGRTWRLTIAERKRILRQMIFGVDIDPQAVEVTKLSLLVKVLEDEQSVISQLSFTSFRERVLPDLDNNIKCGNSLIGSDFYQNQQLSLLDEETRYRINAFDWEREFVDKFDAVIGNPPYVRQELLGEFKSYFQDHYQVYHGIADLYVYFIEKGLLLLREQGHFGIIVANKWMRANYGKSLRNWLKQQNLLEITDFGDLPVFQKATTYPCILCLCKDMPKTTFAVAQVKTLDFTDLQAYVVEKTYSVNQMTLDDTGWSLARGNTQALLDKLRWLGIPLGEYVKGKIFYGIKTGLNEAFVIDSATREKLIAEDGKSADLIKPFLVGRDIKRYQPLKSERFLILIPKGWTKLNSQNVENAWVWLKCSYPSIATHLEHFSEKAQKRCDKGDFWWELRACEYYHEFEKPKIIYPNICKRPEFSFDTTGYYANQKCFIISLPDKYLLGILNSRLTFFLFNQTLPKLRGDFYEPSYVYFKDFPIRSIDFNNRTDKTCHDQIVQLVEQMLELHQQLALAKDPPTKKFLARQIEATDRQIDQLVYTLYDLTAEEIEIVEDTTP